jgi:peptidylprolyl isomerase
MRKLFFFALLLSACTQFPDGYEDQGDGVGKKLLAFGDGEVTLAASTFALVVASASRDGKNDDYWTMSEIFPLDQPFQQGNFEERFLKSTVAGDSIQWIMPYSAFKSSIFNEYEVDGYRIADTATIHVMTSIRQVMDSQTYFESREKAIRERRMEEQQYLSKEFERRGITADVKEYLGTWQRELEIGDGIPVVAGMDLVLGFHGYFLNDSLFDAATDSASWIYFQYGKPDQVIRGLEIGVSNMRIGGKKEMWLTSDLAFGERGSGKGIVPPNTPVRFEIELLDPEKVIKLRSISHD